MHTRKIKCFDEIGLHVWFDFIFSEHMKYVFVTPPTCALHKENALRTAICTLHCWTAYWDATSREIIAAIWKYRLSWDRNGKIRTLQQHFFWTVNCMLNPTSRVYFQVKILQNLHPCSTSEYQKWNFLIISDISLIMIISKQFTQVPRGGTRQESPGWSSSCGSKPSVLKGSVWAGPVLLYTGYFQPCPDRSRCWKNQGTELSMHFKSRTVRGARCAARWLSRPPDGLAPYSVWKQVARFRAWSIWKHAIMASYWFSVLGMAVAIKSQQWAQV